MFVKCSYKVEVIPGTPDDDIDAYCIRKVKAEIANRISEDIQIDVETIRGFPIFKEYTGEYFFINSNDAAVIRSHFKTLADGLSLDPVAKHLIKQIEQKIF